MAGPTIQANYNQYPDHGYPGLCTLPDQPTIIERGILHGTGSPGQALWYDRSEGTEGGFWKVPANAAAARQVTGILSFDQSSVQNASDMVSFASGAEIKVGIMGAFWVTAHENLRYGDRLIYNTTSNRWARKGAFTSAVTSTVSETTVNAAIDSLVDGGDSGINGALVTCATKGNVSAGALFIARFSFSVGQVG